MDALRLSLMIFGALVVGCVYLWSSHLQYKKRQQRIGWEGPDSQTMPNIMLDKSDVVADADFIDRNLSDRNLSHQNVSNQNLSNQNLSNQKEYRLASHDNMPDVDVEKLYTQDVAKESISFNDAGEFKTLSHIIAEAKLKEQNLQTPSVFIKPKIYASKLDETRSHIRAVHDRERQLRKSPKSTGNGLVVVINLLARPGLAFSGERIFSSVEDAGLEYGDMNIFHYFSSSEQVVKQHLFSLANIVNPGTFEKNQMSTLTTPGISLFMQLPASANGVNTFDRMLTTAQTLKKKLDGELCDESRSALTYQTINHLKEKIKVYCTKYHCVE